MSLKVSQLVWKAKLPSTQKLVAVRLADFADDDGCRVFPSNARVARECGLSDRAVREACRALESCGALVLVAMEQPGKHLPREYRFDLAVLERLAEAQNDTPKGGGNHVPPGTSFRPEPASARNVAPDQGEPRSAEPLVNYQEGEGGARPHPITSGVEIIRAFDAERVAAFGAEHARGWPHQSDKVFAERWIAAGADVELCRAVFHAACQKFAKTGRRPPDSLNFFDQRISDALADRNRPMPEGRTNEQRGSVRSARREQPNAFQDLLDAQLAGRA